MFFVEEYVFLVDKVILPGMMTSLWIYDVIDVKMGFNSVLAIHNEKKSVFGNCDTFICIILQIHNKLIFC